MFLCFLPMGIETHRTILLYMIEWFYVPVKNILMTFLRQFLSKSSSNQPLAAV